MDCLTKRQAYMITERIVNENPTQWRFINKKLECSHHRSREALDRGLCKLANKVINEILTKKYCYP